MQQNMKPIISAIAAMAENRTIGNKNQLPWHLPEDLKHFKSITSGHAVLMGRRTYDSIGRPLPNRTNIILTRDINFVAPDCVIASSIDEALSTAKDLGTDEIFVIGGAMIYRQLLPIINKLYLTIVHHKFLGDAHFPEINENEWREISRETHDSDASNAYAYSFIVLERI